MRYFLKLEYNGANFHGWQSQPNAVSVQSTIETALSKILGARTSVTGAGRTDSGVHARCMFAHFDTVRPISDTSRFLLSLNSLSGKDINILELIPVPEEAHARFDASERTYKYFISFNRNPFLKDLSWFCHSRLDLREMNRAAEILLETDDFSSFAKLHSDVKTNICDVRKAGFTEIAEDKEAFDFIGNLNEGVVFTISADRFLRNMVRAVVGTLIEVGRGKMDIEGFRKVIENKNRNAAGTSMPAHALYLWDIKYPFF